MAKFCSECGKKIGVFSSGPLELDSVVLCYECAAPIRDNLNQLWYIKSKKEFLELKNKIISKSRKLYNEETTKGVIEKISSIYGSVAGDLENDTDADIYDDIPEFETAEKDERSESSGSGESGLFADIGKKIKGLAKWTFIVEAIAAVITGLYLGVKEDAIYLLLALFGPIVAWVSSWILYAFGELVDSSRENEKHTKEILEIMKKK